MPVEPPDINVSDAYFTPHGEAIRFGLAAVKNVGHNAIESIVSGAQGARQRSSRSIQFCEKVDLHLLNKRVIESLIKSGAMDSLGRRAQLMAVTDSAMEHAQKTQKDAALGQHGLFGVFQQDEQNQTEKPLPNTPDWDEHHAPGPTRKKSSASSSPDIRWRSISEKLLDFHALTTTRGRRTQVLDRPGRSTRSAAY